MRTCISLCIVSFVLVVVLVTGCTTSGQPPTSLPSTAIIVSTSKQAMPTTTGTRLLTKTPLPVDSATPIATPTALPAVKTPVITASPESQGLSDDVRLFKSTTLGITFRYSQKEDQQLFDAKEIGDKIFIFMTQMPPENGQWVQVYRKSADTSLEDAIKTQVLKGFSLSDCIVTIVNDPNQGVMGTELPGTTFAMIKLPILPDDDMAVAQTKAAKCPQPYSAFGGIAYFMAFEDIPDRFVFFSIGQYMIPAEQDIPWQTTLRFTK